MLIFKILLSIYLAIGAFLACVACWMLNNYSDVMDMDACEKYREFPVYKRVSFFLSILLFWIGHILKLLLKKLFITPEWIKKEFEEEDD